MAIDRNLVQHIKKLARVELTPEEEVTITEQLKRIVEFVEKLQEADTEGVPPTRLMSEDGEDHLREDEVRPGLARDDVLAEAPDATGEFFRVPRVIDRGDTE